MKQEVVTSEIGLAELSDLEKEICVESPETIDITKGKPFWQKLSDWYFQPKFFEKRGKLYEALGIKWFQKYCPTGGSYWTKRGLPSMIEGRKTENLEDFIGLTKMLECVHCGFLPLYVASTTILLTENYYVGAGIGAVLNLGVNIYPIMSQRYNRNKATQLLERLEERKTKKMPAHYK